MGRHGLSVPGAQLEDVADFNASLDLQLALAVGAGVAFGHAAQILDTAQGAIPLPVYPGEVKVIPVGPASEVRHAGGAAIDDGGNLQAHRAQRTEAGTACGAGLLFAGHAQRGGNPGQFLCLDRVQLVVAAQNQRHQFTRFVGGNQQGFNRSGGAH